MTDPAPWAPEVPGNAACGPVHIPTVSPEVDVRLHYHYRLRFVVRRSSDDLAPFGRFESILRETASGAQRMSAAGTLGSCSHPSCGECAHRHLMIHVQCNVIFDLSSRITIHLQCRVITNL